MEVFAVGEHPLYASVNDDGDLVVEVTGENEEDIYFDAIFPFETPPLTFTVLEYDTTGSEYAYIKSGAVRKAVPYVDFTQTFDKLLFMDGKIKFSCSYGVPPGEPFPVGTKFILHFE